MFWQQSLTFIKNLAFHAKLQRLAFQAGVKDMDFESANPTVVKSIKQRHLLHTWLRLYARDRKLPALAEYRPERIEE